MSWKRWSQQIPRASRHRRAVPDEAVVDVAVPVRLGEYGVRVGRRDGEAAVRVGERRHLLLLEKGHLVKEEVRSRKVVRVGE